MLLLLCNVVPHLQNRVTELYSLIRFLRIYPYAHYFCNKCECASLDYPFTKVGCVMCVPWPADRHLFSILGSGVPHPLRYHVLAGAAMLPCVLSLADGIRLARLAVTVNAAASHL